LKDKVTEGGMQFPHHFMKLASISEPLIRTIAEKLCRFSPHCPYLLSL